MANQTRNLEGTEEHRIEGVTSRPLPVLPVRDTVLFPHAVLPLTVGRESSVQLINSLGDEKTIVVVAQREARPRGTKSRFMARRCPQISTTRHLSTFLEREQSWGRCSTIRVVTM